MRDCTKALIAPSNIDHAARLPLKISPAAAAHVDRILEDGREHRWSGVTKSRASTREAVATLSTGRIGLRSGCTVATGRSEWPAWRSRRHRDQRVGDFATEHFAGLLTKTRHCACSMDFPSAIKRFAAIRLENGGFGYRALRRRCFALLDEFSAIGRIRPQRVQWQSDTSGCSAAW